ncbi:hypothetical protein DK847_01125 [Aestuariivirga litoralis]|uniref:Uncharacterized protein n=1 Tax=Aestuariivirga litoralis TaxID=2650924 RepID=A0A2W2ATB8_9HYPH|nr:hypothetical protein [Aestuariivirga litoralis]PZF78451.1 hypothetical protein DK847_01125 [Aestuariivirga litoralis]
MVKPAVKQDRDGLAEALREARLAEAAHFEAARDLRDSKTLRLQILKDDLVPTVQANPEARELFDLTLLPGEPPKLWVDLTAYVVMEPDHRTYRVLQDRQDSRDILFEGRDREQAAAAIRRHMAHRLVARERQAAQLPVAAGAGYSSATLMLAWVSGFAFGALALVAAALYTGLLKY